MTAEEVKLLLLLLLHPLLHRLLHRKRRTCRTLNIQLATIAGAHYAFSTNAAVPSAGSSEEDASYDRISIPTLTH